MTGYYDWKKKQYYRWEVNDFYDVSEKLRELNAKIERKLEPEDLDFYLDDYALAREVNERLNKKVRILARENRKLNRTLNRLIEEVNFLEEIMRKQYKPKDALIW